MKFLAKIRNGKIRVPPMRELKDGTIVEVTITPVEEEKEQ
jgi:hypothetical protein